MESVDLHFRGFDLSLLEDNAPFKTPNSVLWVVDGEVLVKIQSEWEFEGSRCETKEYLTFCSALAYFEQGRATKIGPVQKLCKEAHREIKATFVKLKKELDNVDSTWFVDTDRKKVWKAVEGVK